MPVARFLTSAVAVVALSSAANCAWAQASNFDLVGSRAAGADTQLRARGYQAGRSETVRDNRLTYWRRGDECIQVITRDGKIANVVPAATSYCSYSGGDSSSSSSNTSALVAGVAIVGLAAALAAHNRHHDDAGADHDREYERGYQAGLYGSNYDDRHETEGYHEGYLAGEDESQNRRHSNSRWVRGAPTAAQEACASSADEFQNRPRGSSVPIGVRDLGRGEYELTMATGSYRSRCVVSASGDVRAMNPY